MPEHGLYIFDSFSGKMGLNPLPGDKISGLPKLKAFADDKSNVTQTLKLCFIG